LGETNIPHIIFFSHVLLMHDWVFSLVLITSKGQVGIEASAPARPAQTKYLKYESFALTLSRCLIF